MAFVCKWFKFFLISFAFIFIRFKYCQLPRQFIIIIYYIRKETMINIIEKEVENVG